MTYYSTLVPDQDPPMRLHSEATAPTQAKLYDALLAQAAAFFGYDTDVYLDGPIECCPEIEEGSFSSTQTTAWSGSAIFLNEAATRDEAVSTTTTSTTTHRTGDSQC